MFAEMLIHFHFGKLLHYPYVLLIGEVMPNFFDDVHACCGSNFLLYICVCRATMVLQMSSARIARYKKDAKADMIRCNRRQIRCPCRSCKLMRWIDPDSRQLEEHLLRRGFIDDHNQLAPAAKGAHEDKGERDDEGYVGGEDHHEEGDVGGEDHHDDEGVNTEIPLISALRDSHVQDLLLKEMSNDRAAAREKAKLAQIEIDGVTPLFPGCRPEDTRLHVTDRKSVV